MARALGRPFIGLDNSKGYNGAARKRLASLDGLTPDEMVARIERFVPAEGERADGFSKHKVVKRATRSRGWKPSGGSSAAC